MRIFVAIDIPSSMRENIYSIIGNLKGFSGKLVEKENLHITLRFIGTVQPNELKYITEALRSIKFNRFNIRLKGLGMFGTRVLWIGISKGFEEIVKLHNIIDDKLYSTISLPKDLKFHPHMTIARVKNIYSKSTFDKFIDTYKNHDFGEFEVVSFKLKQSILRSHGPLYIDIEEYRLE